MRYIMSRIPDYKNAVVVSPDAGGAKRATKIADALGMDFALIHKVSKPVSLSSLLLLLTLLSYDTGLTFRNADWINRM